VRTRYYYGNREGGLKAAATNKERYGEDFFSNVGRKGGKISRGGGFADKRVGADGLTHAQRAGAKGGATGRRGKDKQPRQPKPSENHPWRMQPQPSKTWAERIAERIAHLRGQQ
jgi:hypothetical protein